MVMENLANESDVARALAESETVPVFIYKHSPTCHISSMAIREFREFLAGETGGFRYYQVDVIGARAASLEIENLTRIRHESPQALLIWESECVWHASHGRIRASELKAQADLMRARLRE